MPFLASMPAWVSPALTTASTVGGAVANSMNPGGQSIPTFQTPQVDPGNYAYGGTTDAEAQWNQQMQAAQQPAQDAKAKLDQVTQLVNAAKNAPDWGSKAQAESALQQLGYKNKDDAEGSLAGLQQDYATKQNHADQVSKQLGPKPPSFARQEMDRYQKMGADAQGRAATQANLANYNVDRDNSVEARGKVADATALLKSAAEGNAPSAALGTLQNGLVQSNALASSLAANTRGGGGNLGLAALQAQQMQAQNASQASRDAAIIRANEMATARGQYADTTVQARAQELQQMGIDADTAFRQAQLEVQQKELNDRMTLGAEGYRTAVGTAALGGTSHYGDTSTNAQLQTNATNANILSGNRSAAGQMYGDTLRGVSTGVTTLGQQADAYRREQQQKDQQNGQGG